MENNNFLNKKLVSFTMTIVMITMIMIGRQWFLVISLMIASSSMVVGENDGSSDYLEVLICSFMI
ncbi:hypothetical protein Peur_015483 [Populus x canadensis]